MQMLRPFLLLLLLLGTPLWAQSGAPGELVGQVEGNTYLSPTGTFRIAVPVLPELGGRIMDTPNVVTFQDDFNFVCTIATFPMDATQRWELATRGVKDYLTFYFSSFVMPDFRQTFPGARVENAKYAPSIANGSLLVYTLLPGGSMFAHRLAFLAPGEKIPDAKRGNLMFVRNDWVFVVSVELAERVLERSSYTKTTEEEDEILRQRLIDLVDKIEFTAPKAELPR
jgi:hypothetical protein